MSKRYKILRRHRYYGMKLFEQVQRDAEDVEILSINKAASFSGLWVVTEWRRKSNSAQIYITAVAQTYFAVHPGH